MINAINKYFTAMQELAEATESLKQTREQIAIAIEEFETIKTQEWELPEE